MFVILTKPDCKWCDQAKILLEKLGHEYTALDITEHPSLLQFMEASKLTTVPQVFCDGVIIGGFDKLQLEFSFDEITPKDSD